MAGSEKPEPTASDPEPQATAETAVLDDRQRRLDEQTLELIERSLVGAGEMVAV